MRSEDIIIRPETEADLDAIRLVVAAAFESEAEADLVDRITGDQICIFADVVMDDAPSAEGLADALDGVIGLQVVETSAETVHLEQCRTET